MEVIFPLPRLPDLLVLKNVSFAQNFLYPLPRFEMETGLSDSNQRQAKSLYLQELWHCGVIDSILLALSEKVLRHISIVVKCVICLFALALG